MHRHATFLLDVIDGVAYGLGWGLFWLAQFILPMLTALVLAEFMTPSEYADVVIGLQSWALLVMVAFAADVIGMVRQLADSGQIFAGTGDTEPLEPRRLKGSDR